MQKRIGTLAVAAAALLGAACGGLYDGNGDTGYKSIGAGGGEVHARDTVVTVPEGAVDEETTFTIAPAPAEELPEGAAGLAVDVGPEGAEFKEAVTIDLRFDASALPDPTRPDLVWLGTVVDGEWEPLLDPVIDEASGRVRGTTRRAGRFGVVHGCGRARRCPVALDFVGGPLRVMAGDCSPATELRTVDHNGRASPVLHDTAVVLSADEPSVSFYLDSGCARDSISSVVIPARQSGATVYFRGRAARGVTLTAQARDLRQGTHGVTIYPGPGITFGFITAPQRVMTGACSSASTLAFEDAYGNRSPVLNDARMTLSANAAGTVGFYSDGTCTTPTAGITIPAGSASGSLWFKYDLQGPANETITLAVTVGAFGGSFTASQDQTVASRQAVAVRYFSLPQDISVGACSGVTMVGLVDETGNRTPATATTAVSLSAPASVVLYADSACTVQTSTTWIPGGGMSASFYFRALNAGTFTITATSSGLGSATQDETVR